VVFGHKEIDQNNGGVGTIGSVQKEGKSFTTVKYGEGVEGLSYKPFKLHDLSEVDAN